MAEYVNKKTGATINTSSEISGATGFPLLNLQSYKKDKRMIRKTGLYLSSSLS